MRLPLFLLLFTAVLATGCATEVGSGPTSNAVIPGTAMTVRLAPDSTWIPLTDFCPGSTGHQVFCCLLYTSDAADES